MRKLISFFIDYPIWANGLILLTAIFGLLAISGTKSSYFPVTESRIISVSVAYPGASPEEMEQGVTSRIENQLRGVVGIDEIQSASSENTASITINVLENEDLDEVLQDVKNSLDRINSFPDGAEKPIIFKGKNRSTAARLAIYGEMDLLELKKVAQDVENDLLASGSISQIDITGFPDLEIVIEVDEEALLKYNLTFDQLAIAVRNNNIDLSGGIIKDIDEEIILRSRQRKTDPKEIENIVVKSLNDGSQIRLKDIAIVKEQFAEVASSNYLNGAEMAQMEVKKLDEEDLETITVFVEDYIDQFNDRNEAVQIKMVRNYYNQLQERIDMLTSNGLLGVIFVCLALGIFLNLRLSVWVAWGIPASFLGMFILGAFVPITINMISLFGMIVVVGILVDDGIVIAENIFVHYEKGKSPRQAAIDGTMEVIPAVFTSISTTILAFIPLLMIQGSNFMAEMAIVVIASLGFSLIEAALVLPSHLANKKTLSKANDQNWIGRQTDQLMHFLKEKTYAPVLRWAIKFKYITVTIPFIFIAIVIGLIGGGHVGLTFFPSIPYDDISIDIAFKPGERETKTQAYLERFEKAVWEVNDEIIAETGDTTILYTVLLVGSTKQLGESGGHAGHVQIDIDTEGKAVSSYDIARRVREKIGPIPEAEKYAVGSAGRWGKPVAIKLQGKDLEELRKAKEWLRARLETIPKLREVTDNLSVGKNELQLNLKDQAYFLGFTSGEIARQIRQAYFGEEVQRIVKGQDEVKIWLRYPLTDRSSLEQLDRMQIRSATGQLYPLRELAEFDIQRGVTQIKRFNGAREIEVSAEFTNPSENAVPVNQEIAREFLPKLKAQFPSVVIAQGGAGKFAKKTVASVNKFLPLSILLMFLLISLNFRSFYQSILVMLLIPVGLASAVVGHMFHDVPLSVLSLFGALALGGIIVNDAVVLLDQYNRNIKNGMSVEEAAFEAGKSRFRAIMLTSLTTVAGLAPLIFETSFQAKFIIPMAIVMAYGVALGTVFILIFFPVIILSGNAFMRRLNIKGLSIDYTFFIFCLPLIIGIFSGIKPLTMIGLPFLFLGPFIMIIIKKFVRKSRGTILISKEEIEPALIEKNRMEEEHA